MMVCQSVSIVGRNRLAPTSVHQYLSQATDSGPPVGIRSYRLLRIDLEPVVQGVVICIQRVTCKTLQQYWPANDIGYLSVRGCNERFMVIAESKLSLYYRTA